MKSLFLHLLIASAINFAVYADQAPVVIDWGDMKGKLEFEDPFVTLSHGQVYKLALVARVRAIDERRQKVSEEMRKEAAEAGKELLDQGVDVDGLLEKRKQIKAMRKKRSGMPVAELDGKHVKLSGFVLPLEYEEKKVKEFLLVPWVGACIHTPPPPENQIAHVVVEEAFATKGTFEAVTVLGKIQIEKRESELFLVDGKATIQMSYVFRDAAVEKYKRP